MTGVDNLVASQNCLGEGPLWHIAEQALYWVDIHGRLVERYHTASGRRQTFRFDRPVTALGLRHAGGFIVAWRKGFAFWDGQSEALESIVEIEADLPDNRFNDGAVDPGGHFFAGTMYAGPGDWTSAVGSLYRLDPDRRIHAVETGLTISNGLGWSPDLRSMYFTDTLRHVIYAYDYEPESGAISNRRDFVRVPEASGFPDGLAVDREGCVWSACWGGWKVVRYDPQGIVEREIHLPVECPSSCAFGGAQLNQLYITSAWIDMTPEQRVKQPWAGDVFRVDVDVAGMPVNLFAG